MSCYDVLLTVMCKRLKMYCINVTFLLLFCISIMWDGLCGVYGIAGDCFVLNHLLSSVGKLPMFNFPYRSTVRSFLLPMYKSTAIL